MRCNNCPAYWEERDYFYGVEDWGCYCDPNSGNDCGREWFEVFALNYVETVEGDLDDDPDWC